ncbi:MAG: B12-binding domain-containing radical SAM protein [Treponema sp.]|nr:B12-binding domain-containing radical SAM protein [Treponema sp.]
MKILLVSVNASYMHTNLAIRDLKNYAERDNVTCSEIQLAEYTINQPVGEVLRGIASFAADWILFSTYIWNAEYVCKLLPEIKKILPDCLLGAGGPEFGYGAKKYLTNIAALDFIIFGEGEETFREMIEKCGGDAKALRTNMNGTLAEIKGLYYRKDSECREGKYDDEFYSTSEIAFTGSRDLICNLDDLPFPYPEIAEGRADPDHKIYYYESSRGCPFSCSYCLSSVDKRVRFKSLERACSELQIFLDHNIKLVKFVDRTYNLDENHYLGIWNYIMKHHNGKTMFHFEIEAEYLSEKALDFLQQIPEGMMQFEMGVQSANKKTLAAINRSTNVEALAEKIRKIPRTIHQHLDLIAGLPYEDLQSFGQSYDFVMALRPDALQLGFLKILGGTQMEEYAKANGWKWMESPAYETFSTPYLSFSDIAFLKDMEVLTDAYWNKGSFAFTMNYIFRKTSPWEFLSALVKYGRSLEAFSQARRESYWFELLCNAIDSLANSLDKNLIYDLLRYDFVRAGKKGNFPSWYRHNYDKDKHKKLLEENGLLENSRIGFAITEYEEFEYNVLAERPELEKTLTQVLIRYK